MKSIVFPVIGCFCCLSCNIKEPKTVLPNVIFILTDDQGYGDMGIAGHPYMKTPNIDRIAKEGTRFTQFYVNSTVSAPSRVGFMTGMFPARHNVHHIYSDPDFDKKHGTPVFLDPKVLTVADLMKSAGYSTGHFGKWHLCGNESGSPTPDQYGFDSWLISHSGGQSPLYKKRFDSTPFQNTKASHWIVDDGIEFIENHRKDGKPFYLNLWTLVPHGFLNPSPEELEIYKDLKTDSRDFNSWMRTYADSAMDLNSQMKIFCASMTSLDSAIGNLLTYLDEKGLSDNTIILFASDNGPEDYHVGDCLNAGVGSSSVFRGRKRSIYEGGIRVPCIVRWPGHVPAGKISDFVWSGVDWMPTLASLTGTSLPENYKSDGEDVSGIFNGKYIARMKPLFWEWKYEVFGNSDYLPPQLAVRKKNWKFLCYPDGSGQELYDLSSDPEERNNLRDIKPEIVSDLKKILLDWKKTIPESAYTTSESGQNK
jgi:arylsulfatase A-like enzyme